MTCPVLSCAGLIGSGSRFGSSNLRSTIGHVGGHRAANVSLPGFWDCSLAVAPTVSLVNYLLCTVVPRTYVGTEVPKVGSYRQGVSCRWMSEVVGATASRAAAAWRFSPVLAPAPCPSECHLGTLCVPASAVYCRSQPADLNLGTPPDPARCRLLRSVSVLPCLPSAAASRPLQRGRSDEHLNFCCPLHLDQSANQAHTDQGSSSLLAGRGPGTLTGRGNSTVPPVSTWWHSTFPDSPAEN
jgi:hypothetical protein